METITMNRNDWTGEDVTITITKRSNDSQNIDFQLNGMNFQLTSVDNNGERTINLYEADMLRVTTDPIAEGFQDSKGIVSVYCNGIEREAYGENAALRACVSIICNVF